jgi:D-aminoacyl-tRNA deacylase
MKAVVQRVARARSQPGGSIGAGLVVLLGIAAEDDEPAARGLAAKIARLRVFADDEGKLDRSLVDVGGEALVVSQFTLVADSTWPKGTRPGFSRAARPEVAEPLYRLFCDELRALGVPVQTGVFGAHMQVELVNDGPVTIVLEL